MIKETFFASCFLFILTGCVYNDEAAPEIVYNYRAETMQPQQQAYRESLTRDIERVPADWFAPAGLEHDWTAIIIHHSGTENGNAAIFDKWHRQGNHWEGVGYDFVIGNGTDSGDGRVEVTYRWRNQKTGAHCGGTAGNWANREAVGICLVGNFNEDFPTALQMDSLAKLVRFLQLRYSIPRGRIYGHGTTPGAGPTDCPGVNFSMAKLKSMVEF